MSSLFRSRRALLALAAAWGLLSAPVWLTGVLHVLLFHPTRAEDPAAARLGERVRYVADDGVQLAGWWVAAPRGERRRTVLYFHGNGGTASHVAPFAAELAARGSDVLLAEYRGYGESEGLPSAHGVERDADAAWRYLVHDRGVPPGEIVVFGRSLGGAAAVHVLAGEGRGAARGVLHSTFASLHLLGRHRTGLPLTSIVPDAYALDSIAAAPRVRAPVLQLHGDADTVVPLSHAEQLHARLGGPRRFVRVPGGGHNLRSDAADAAIRAFLERDQSARMQ